MSRPIYFNVGLVGELAFTGHSNVAIARVVGCHPATLSKRTDVVAILSDARRRREETITRAIAGERGKQTTCLITTSS